MKMLLTKCLKNRLVQSLVGLVALSLVSGPVSAAGPEKAPARRIDLDVAQATKPVDRFFDLSVGSDYPGTLIRDDSQVQLKTAVDEIGFRGFTPKALKTSDNSIFYWQGNTSHPAPQAWKNLVEAFVRHIQKRYGTAEVRTWFFEVWNEPNLDGFWEKADQKAYFELYDLTANTIKAIDTKLRVGGPSTAGAAWVPELLNHVAHSGAPIDFITTHAYGVDGGFLDEEGKSDTKLAPQPGAIVDDVRRVRQQIEASRYAGLPLYFTEWSTSYTPRDLVHDSYISAPYILSKLKACQGLLQGMSYWVYTDLFEEPGPPDKSFHGGFGLLNREGIRKSAYFAYKYLHALEGNELPSTDSQMFASTRNGNVTAVIWDFQQPVQKLSNKPFYSRLVPAADSAPLEFEVRHLKAGHYRLTVHRTGYRANDPYSAYIDLGMPKDLTPAQIAEMHKLTADTPEVDQTIEVGKDGMARASVGMRGNDVVLVKIEKQ
jgi:xylan 1,4-beta-xylosidase